MLSPFFSFSAGGAWPRQQAYTRSPAAADGYGGGWQRGQHHREEEDSANLLGFLVGAGKQQR
jgi:hypothetical protein